MSPEDVPAEWVEKAARARIGAQWGRDLHDVEWEGVRSRVEEKWMAAALAAVLPLAQAAARKEALSDAADAWQTGQWADAPRRADRVQERLANAQHVTDWLRARAAQVNP